MHEGLRLSQKKAIFAMMLRYLPLIVVGALLTLLSACAGHLHGRALRFHDTREVTRAPAAQEGGRQVTSPSRRASSSRPRGEEDAHHPLAEERMDVDRYRVFIETAEDERRARYGSGAGAKAEVKASPKAKGKRRRRSNPKSPR